MQERQETVVRSLGWEDPPVEGVAFHSSTLATKSHGQRSLVGSGPWGCKDSDTMEVTEHAWECTDICMHVSLSNLGREYKSDLHIYESSSVQLLTCV